VDVRDATETLRHAGWYGVLLFNFMFTMGQLMRMPGFIFLIIGGITYGRVYGFVVNILALPVVLGVQFVIYRKCARPLSLAAFFYPLQCCTRRDTPVSVSMKHPPNSAPLGIHLA
jgi:uncharacterized membrane protein YdjX (TVP38/TMEM64 family)